MRHAEKIQIDESSTGDVYQQHVENSMPIDYEDWSIDGIFYHIPPDIYYPLDRASQSTLKIACKQTLQHMRHAMLQPQTPTAALERGSALHTLILEPDEFENRVVVGLDIDRRSNKNKEAWADYEATHAGKTILKPAMFDDVRHMADAINNHDAVKALLADGGNFHREATALWPETFAVDDSDDIMVCPCKARLDWLAPDINAIIDIKTTTDASHAAFGHAIKKYGYHHQASFYRRAARRYFPTINRHLFVIVENTAPYCCAVYSIDDIEVQLCAEMLYQSMRAAAFAYKTDNWTGYSPQIERMELGASTLFDN